MDPHLPPRAGERLDAPLSAVVGGLDQAFIHGPRNEFLDRERFSDDFLDQQLERVVAQLTDPKGRNRAETETEFRQIQEARLNRRIEALTEGGTITVGRSSGNDIAIPHRYVSRQHAEISLRRGELVLRDRSTNGCYLNGSRIHAQHTVQPGDRIQFAEDGPTFQVLATPIILEESREERLLMAAEWLERLQIGSASRALSLSFHADTPRVPALFAEVDQEHTLHFLEVQGAPEHRSPRHSVSREELPQFLERNPSFRELLEKAAKRLTVDGEFRKSAYTVLALEGKRVESRDIPTLEKGSVVCTGPGERGEIKGFVGGSFLVSTPQGEVSLSPQELLLLNPERVDVGIELRVVNSYGEIEDGYRVQHYDAMKRQYTLQKRDERRDIVSIKQVSLTDLLRCNSLFDDEQFLIENHDLIPLDTEVVLPDGTDVPARVKGHTSHALIVAESISTGRFPFVRREEVLRAVEPEVVVTHNRVTLLGETPVVAAMLQHGAHQFRSGARCIASCWRLELQNHSVDVVIPDGINHVQVLRKLNELYRPINDAISGCVKRIFIDPGSFQGSANQRNAIVAAEGGRGEILFYEGTRFLTPAIFYHEFGHNLAREIFGSTTPDDDWRWRMQEGPVSEYGEREPQGIEDFADSVSRYLEARTNGARAFYRWCERYQLRAERLDQISRYGR